MRTYPTLHALRSGEVVDLGGIHVKMTPGDIAPGDLYVAERNSGPHLLTAKRVDAEAGCVLPTCFGYPYGIGECVRVCEAE